jgi:replicative DNA helicase Mcm
MTEPLEQFPREDCYFCDEDTDVLEEHHLVPRRKGGTDNDENLVQVCPTCHQKLEQLYDDRFYNALGANDPEDVITYALEYVLSELDRVEDIVSTEVQDTRDHIEAIQSKDILEDEDEIREHVADAITEYCQSDSSENNDSTGTSKEQRERIKEIKAVITSLEDNHAEGAPIERIIDLGRELGYDEDTVLEEIENLRIQGKVYEPRTDYLRTT